MRSPVGSPDREVELADNRLSLCKKVGFSVTVTLVFFMLAEVGMRGWVYYLREDYTRYEPTTGMPLLVPGEHGRSDDPVTVNRDGFVGNELEPDAPDLFRIVALGDSNTFGHGSRRFAYPAFLDQKLRERETPGRRFEVINAGIEGMDSRQALYRLETKVLPLGPEVVVIYIGWNDLMKYDPLGQTGQGVVPMASRWVDRLWLVKAIRKFVFVYLMPRFNPPRTGPESHTGAFADFTPTAYIDNVRTMIRLIRESGAEPVLMTLATVVRPDFSAEDIVQANVYFPYYPSAYAVGDFLDLVATYNQAVADIAEIDSVPVVDLHAMFGARPDYRQLMFDTMHPSREGYAMVADEVLATLEAARLLERPPGPVAPAD
jgi:lysophospholipase L1-like esterase